MLKKTLTKYLFLGLLSSVRSEGGNPESDIDYKISPEESFRDKCSEVLDQSACIYWDSLQDDIGHFQTQKAIQNQQKGGLSSENSTVPREGIPEENSEELFVDDPFVDFRNYMNKRFYVFRRRNPNAQGYKRGPGFRSWGGKRNFDYVENPLAGENKFTSWGGKRDDSLEESNQNDKRSKFGSWGGKRHFDYSSDKRTGFKSWGGKRTLSLEHAVKKDAEILNTYGGDKRGPILNLDEPYKKHFLKRPQFQSWGGKRALHPLHRFLTFFYTRPLSVLNGEKRKFSSWGGKRSYENQHNGFWEQMKNELKRHNFQSWGGKRAFSEESQHSDQIEEPKTKKANFKNEHSDLGFDFWGRKRGGGR